MLYLSGLLGRPLLNLSLTFLLPLAAMQNNSLHAMITKNVVTVSSLSFFFFPFCLPCIDQYSTQDKQNAAGEAVERIIGDAGKVKGANGSKFSDVILFRYLFCLLTKLNQENTPRSSRTIRMNSMCHRQCALNLRLSYMNGLFSGAAKFSPLRWSPLLIGS